MEFWKVGRPFELRDVTTEEHIRFVFAFAARAKWNSKKDGTSVIFSPPIDKEKIPTGTLPTAPEPPSPEV